LILLSAIYSPKREKYIQTMPTLSTASQAALKDLIVEVMESAATSTDNGTNPTSDNEGSGNSLAKPSRNVDQELLFEERFGKVLADNENFKSEIRELQEANRDLHDRLARLQENNVGFEGDFGSQGAD
jgi:hypothetical protein